MIWHPAPRGLITAAAAIRWTRARPAPDLVVYLWTWSQRDDGAPPTRRQLAAIFGWTEHRARIMIERVRNDQNEWRESYSPEARAGRQPGQANDFSKLGAQIAQKSPKNRQESPDRGRGNKLHTQNKTRERGSLESEDIWQVFK